MYRIRFFIFVLIGFVTALFSNLFSPGTFVNRILAIGLCSIFSFNSTHCAANWAISSDRVVAATPPAIEFSVDNSDSKLSQNNNQIPPAPRNLTPVILQNDDDKKMDFTSQQGCRIIENLQTVNGQTVPNYFEYIAKDKASCGESFTARLSPDGKMTQVTMKSGEDVLIEQASPNSFKITVTDREGKKTVQNLEVTNDLVKSNHLIIHNNLDKNNHKNLISKEGCAVINQYCETIKTVFAAPDTIQSLVILKPSLFEKITREAIELAFAPLGLVQMIADAPCFIFEGGNPTIPGERLLKKIGKVFGAFGKGLDDSKTVWDTANFWSKQFTGKEITNRNFVDDLRDVIGIPAPCKEKNPDKGLLEIGIGAIVGKVASNGMQSFAWTPDFPNTPPPSSEENPSPANPPNNSNQPNPPNTGENTPSQPTPGNPPAQQPPNISNPENPVPCTSIYLGEWEYSANKHFEYRSGVGLVEKSSPFKTSVEITQTRGKYQISGFYPDSKGAAELKIENNQITSTLPLNFGQGELTATISAGCRTIKGGIIISDAQAGKNKVTIPFELAWKKSLRTRNNSAPRKSFLKLTEQPANQELSDDRIAQFPFPVRIPRIPGIPNASDLLRREILKQLVPYIESERAFTTGIKDIYPTTSEIPGGEFKPSEENLRVFNQMLREAKGSPVISLPPGDYEIPGRVFCFKPRTYGPQNFVGYPLAPIKGKQADALIALNSRHVLAGIPHNQAQVLSWDIQLGVKYEDMSQQSREIVNQIMPEFRQQLSRSFWEDLPIKWNQISRLIPNAPSFERVISELPKEVQQILSIYQEGRAALQQYRNDFDQLQEQMVLEGTAPRSSGDDKYSREMWSKLNDRAYARLLPTSYIGPAKMQIRVLP